MKRRLNWKMLILGCLLLVFLASCASQDDGLCAGEERPCIAVKLEGENCTFEGPTDTQTGKFTVKLINDGEDQASFEVMTVDADKTLADLEEFIATNPSAYQPTWVHEAVGLLGELIPVGETVSVERIVLPGEYGVVCVEGGPFPFVVRYGGQFAIEE